MTIDEWLTVAAALGGSTIGMAVVYLIGRRR
jgi:membrane protein DedA with SNARE-associated domain